MPICFDDDILDEFFRHLRPGMESVLLVDYDGTLSPFGKDPDFALPYPEVPALLDRMILQGARVVVVTGRRAKDIPPLLRLEFPIEVWGSHGMERLCLNGKMQVAKIQERDELSLMEASASLELLNTGARLEYKPGAVALHWRGLAPEAISVLERRTADDWSVIAHRSGLTLMPFDGGLELRVDRPNKGDVVRTILNESSKNTVVAYLGDDHSDEDAFVAIQGRGLSVLVRPEHRVTAADLWLKPPADVEMFLRRWTASLQGARCAA